MYIGCCIYPWESGLPIALYFLSSFLLHNKIGAKNGPWNLLGTVPIPDVIWLGQKLAFL